MFNFWSRNLIFHLSFNTESIHSDLKSDKKCIVCSKKEKRFKKKIFFIISSILILFVALVLNKIYKTKQNLLQTQIK
jgi:hypothetical protein